MLRNYLLSLYEHVKELAFVVAQCESKSAGIVRRRLFPFWLLTAFFLIITTFVNL